MKMTKIKKIILFGMVMTMGMSVLAISSKADTISRPVYGGKKVNFDSNYPLEMGPKGFVEDGVLAEKTKLLTCILNEFTVEKTQRVSFNDEGLVTWWSPEPTRPGWCICENEISSCPGDI